MIKARSIYVIWVFIDRITDFVLKDKIKEKVNMGVKYRSKGMILIFF